MPGRPKKKKKREAIPNVHIRPGGTMPRDITYFKPSRYKNFFTLAEMSREVGVDPSWLRKLERAGRIPEAQRVQRGQLNIRLWSPAQRDEIVEIIGNHRVGRPPKDD
jgi:hypothetical protein